MLCWARAPVTSTNIKHDTKIEQLYQPYIVDFRDWEFGTTKNCRLECQYTLRNKTTVKNKIVILGGGVAGMSAAHELVERGFDVYVYECKSMAGGKARSIPASGTSKDGRKELPGEHGFRFFPRFYKHVTDTMKRIPYQNNKNGVYDNLVDTTRIELARKGGAPVIIPSKFPTSIKDVQLIFKDIFGSDLQLTDNDIEFFVQRIWQLLTSCQERRLEEYEKLGWWEYLEANRYSAAYKSLLARGLTRSLVASKAELASTRTVGKIFLQLLYDILEPGISSDRVLNGPTSEVWINPWLEYLQNRGVHYHLNSQVTAINCVDGIIQSITIKNQENNHDSQVQGDYYIAALPVEVITGLLTPDLIKADPILENIKQLSLSTAWMNGIQFYLKEDVEITQGHVLYVDSPWALTSISQKQFWSNQDLSRYGDGTVKGIISVCISDWGFYIDPATGQAGVTDNSLGELIPKRANHCTPEEVKEEVWYQLKKSLNVNGKEILKDENLHSWFLDPDIASTTATDFKQIIDSALPESLKELFIWIMNHEGDKTYVTLAEVANYLQQDETLTRTLLDLLVGKGFVKQLTQTGELHYRTRLEAPDNINLEPLLVNLINTWHLRPDASTRIPNLFLAADYLRTNTDLATMEGANEAARRAVNCIIDVSGSHAPYCKIWDSQEPDVFFLWRWRDYIRYKQGLSWNETLPWALQILQNIYLASKKLIE